MTDLMNRCIEAVRDAKTCAEHDLFDESEGCYGARRAAMFAFSYDKNGKSTPSGCTACADSLVRAVLDEFIREPATEALGELEITPDRWSAIWMTKEREKVREIFAAQRRDAVEK